MSQVRILPGVPNLYNKEIKLSNGLKSGYKFFYDKDHPLAHADGSVYLHRHLASLYLGRWLKYDEVVHHKNENKLDNNKENLEVLTNVEHSRLHNPSLAEIYSCKTCKKVSEKMHSSQEYCSYSCHKASLVKSKELTRELLEGLMPYNTWVSLGKLFGYSDNGIKKRAKSLGADLNLIRSKI